MAHKTGFVNILGNPNVGKSTLMNVLVGERLAVVTSKAQTTRHRILGIVSGDDFQIVYSDTPGIIKPYYLLQETMMSYVASAFTDADIILYVTDVVETPDKNSRYIDRIGKAEVPVIVAINKIDRDEQSHLTMLMDKWKELLAGAEVIPISALYRSNTDFLFERIMKLTPEGPPYYPKDTLTDKPVKFFIAEIIRGSIFRNYRKEIPYSVEVAVESFKEEEHIIKILAVIYVMRSSQKGIIIGGKGNALKKTATESRLEIEKFLGSKVYLETMVKVRKNWRDSSLSLKNFGY